MVSEWGKGTASLRKIREFWGPLGGLSFIIFLAVVMVVFVATILKSNLEIISQDIPLIKEKSISRCCAGPLAHVHMENFNLT